jgi:F0F1-type ATP synthase membrane subunit b/b'
MEILLPIVLAIVGVGTGAGGVVVAGRLRKNNVSAKADKMIADAKKEASTILLKATEEAKKDEEERRAEAKKPKNASKSAKTTSIANLTS